MFRIINILMSQQILIMQAFSKVKLILKTSKKQIWLVKNVITKQLFILKTQSLSQVTNKKSKNLLHQAKFMQNLQGYLGIPNMIWAGKQQQTNCLIFIMQRLGTSLKQLFEKGKEAFGLKQICTLGIILFEIINSIHSKGYAYGNLKLEVIQFGLGSSINNVYINDLMDCVVFIKNYRHVKRSFTNSKLKIHQFMSYDIIQGLQARPKDDICSVLYIIIYLLKGQLPWTQDFANLQGHNIFIEFQQESEIYDSANKYQKDFKQTTKDQTILKFNKTNGEPFKFQNLKVKLFNKIKSRIQSIKIEQICSGLDVQFRKMLEKCQQLRDQQKPDYNYFTRSLKKILFKNGYDQELYLNGIGSQSSIKKKDYKNLNLSLVNQEKMLQECYLPFEKSVQLK